MVLYPKVRGYYMTAQNGNKEDNPNGMLAILRHLQ